MTHGARRIAKKIEEKKLITAVGFQDQLSRPVFNMVKDELPKHKPGGLVYGAWVRRHPRRVVVAEEVHLRRPAGRAEHSPAGRPALSVWRAARACGQPHPPGIVEPGENGVNPDYDTDDHSTCSYRVCKDNFTATLVSCVLSQAA